MDKKFNELEATDQVRIDAERDRRRYVKRDGGLVKGLSETDAAKATKLCDDYGLSDDKGWDGDVSIPNLEYINKVLNQE